MGYIGQSRSVRSQMAIDEGLLTKSQLKAWQKRAVEAGEVSPCEWHHTGKYFNRTNYYNPADFEELNPKDFPPIKTVKEAVEEPEIWYVLVSAQWGGTKRYPKIVGTDAVVTNRITNRQRYAKKYDNYGGHIKEFENKEDALAYARTISIH